MVKQASSKQEVSWGRVGGFAGGLCGIALLVVAWQQGWLKRKSVEATVAPVQMQTLHKNENAQATVSTGLGQLNPTPPDVAVELASMNVGCKDAFPINWRGYAWNGELAGIHAIGGEESTEGSLTCKRGIHVKFERKDSNDALQQLLVDFATANKNGEDNPKVGTHFINLMGDGTPAFLYGANQLLSKLGPDYTAKVVAAFGKSFGEDACMGPPEWAKNPQALRGSLIVAVIMDGDWAVCVRYALENQICVNPDPTTYDPNCMNFIAAPDNDYIKAVEAWASGSACADLRNTKTGATERQCAKGVATWTPGDKLAANKGGVVKFASTRIYDNQMPSVVIGIDHWMKTHRQQTVAFIGAGLEGGAQIKSSVRALRRASVSAALAFKQQDADAGYWFKYYLGQREIDAAGLEVEIGGSQAFDLSDNMAQFGLGGVQGSYRDVFNTFGATVAHYYPKSMPRVPNYDSVVDTSYLEELLKSSPVTPKPVIKTVSYDEVAKAPEHVQVGNKDWSIQFDSGKATIKAESIPTLQKLKSELMSSQTTAIEIHGHTDSTGTPDGNMTLSAARALAVETWLMNQDAQRFAASRFKVVPHGQDEPVAPNTTAQGMAQNRRVVIKTLFK